MQRFLYRVDDIDPGALKPEHVKVATLIRLPFHLCTGPLFRFVDPDEASSEVWLRNSVSIPHDVDHSDARHAEVVQRAWTEGVRIWHTDSLLLNHCPEFAPDEFHLVCKAHEATSSSVDLAGLRNVDFQLLGELLTAHQMVRVGPYIAGSGAMWPRRLSKRELIPLIVGEFVLIAGKDREISADVVSRVFDSADRLQLDVHSGGAGEVNNFSPDQIAALSTAVKMQRQHAFYELKSNALSAMLHGDSIVANVLACAALEGAHSVFLRHVLEEKPLGKLKYFDRFIGNLLREHGFYTLIQLTVREYMTDDERPSEEDLERCLSGVSNRNAIMHASNKGAGRYKLTKLSTSEINDGYSGIMAVYRAFEAAIESRCG